MAASTDEKVSSQPASILVVPGVIRSTRYVTGGRKFHSTFPAASIFLTALNRPFTYSKECSRGRQSVACTLNSNVSAVWYPLFA
jgi:hypothetical protein